MLKPIRNALIIAALVAAGHAGAEEQAANDYDILEGSWTVAAAEQSGQAFDVIVGGILTIQDASFSLVTATGNEIAGTLHLDAGATPARIDFLLASGEVWDGIYASTGDVLRLNYVERGDAERPAVFATTADTPGTVIVLRRTDYR